jgi:hypothetical protein
MAIKVGAENKRNVIIAGVLFCVLAYLGISQLIGGSSPSPAPVHPIPTQPRQAPETPIVRNTTTAPAAGGTARNEPGPEARRVAGSGLDPALHLEKLASSESIDYAGSGRNIFSAESAPVVVEKPVASARPAKPVVPVYTPPPVPQPPAIELRYFGYSASKDGKREAFLVHGDDIFEAAPGEIVNHRYKVVAINTGSVQVTDLSYNNTQTLPLTTN